VKLQPGTPVRISGWVKLPENVTASTDGVLLYDSAGGEPLAVRMTGATKRWKQFTMYRKVPKSGSINLTVALTGLGKVYFDDLEITPLTAVANAPVGGISQGPSLRSPRDPSVDRPGNTPASGEDAPRMPR
jgi:hypothetical protein